MIAALSGAFISGMYLFLEAVNVLTVLVMLTCLGLGTWALFRMIRLNRREVRARVDSAVNHYHEYIAQWTVEAEQWRRFLQGRFALDKRESNGYGYALAGVFTFLIALLSFSALRTGMLMAVLIASFLVFFLVGKWGSMLGARRRLSRESAFGEGQVHFAEKLVVYNGRLIMLEDFGTKLMSFELEDRFGMDVLSFRVETGFGSRRSQSRFLIPIPYGKEEMGEKLVRHYAVKINES
ncbi:MAG: hypothetical protein Roseis2KO_23260 [Roseivirga sp.]